MISVWQKGLKKKNESIANNIRSYRVYDPFILIMNQMIVTHPLNLIQVRLNIDYTS